VHQPLKQSIASGMYSSFIAPTDEHELFDSKATKRHASIGRDWSRNSDIKAATLDAINSVARKGKGHSMTPKGDKNVSFGESFFMKNNPFTKSVKMGDTMTTGGQAINNKFEMSKTLATQAVGGPKKDPSITMWDMMTLYDTQKKKVEDQAAYFAYKKQQREHKLSLE
jgi:hypothetical protein